MVYEISAFEFTNDIYRQLRGKYPSVYNGESMFN